MKYKKNYTHLHKAREIKYKFILDNSFVFRVEKMCIKRSLYYAWLKRPPSERKINDEKLILEIKRVHKESYELKYDGIECGKNKISKLLKEYTISNKITRKYKATTYSDYNYAVASNLLKQDFNIEAPKRAYVGDITYIRTKELWLYLATVINLFDREVVG